MYYVYILQSTKYPHQLYTGFTRNLKLRLKKHNEGGSPHTSKYRPWEIITYTAFTNQAKALAFEKFLKSGSGKEFATRRFLS